MPKTHEQRRKHRIQAYGITVDEYNAMYTAQNGGCYICGEPEIGKSLSIDHDHVSGKVRGLLCSNHNRALGLMQDDPDILLKAHEYLVKDHG